MNILIKNFQIQKYHFKIYSKTLLILNIKNLFNLLSYNYKKLKYYLLSK